MSENSQATPSPVEIELPDGAHKSRGICIKTELVRSEQQIHGYLDGRHLITLVGDEDGHWHVAMSSALPVSVQQASQHLACMQQVFDRAREYGMNAQS